MADGDDSVREIRISCPDATGLGCDIARMLLDFGLRILSGAAAALLVHSHQDARVSRKQQVHSICHTLMSRGFAPAGDLSTDGKWCFLIIKVCAASCPQPGHALNTSDAAAETLRAEQANLLAGSSRNAPNLVTHGP